MVTENLHVAEIYFFAKYCSLKYAIINNNLEDLPELMTTSGLREVVLFIP